MLHFFIPLCCNMSHLQLNLWDNPEQWIAPNVLIRRMDIGSTLTQRAGPGIIKMV